MVWEPFPECVGTPRHVPPMLHTSDAQFGGHRELQLGSVHPLSHCVAAVVFWLAGVVWGVPSHTWQLEEHFPVAQLGGHSSRHSVPQ